MMLPRRAIIIVFILCTAGRSYGFSHSRSKNKFSNSEGKDEIVEQTGSALFVKYDPCTSGIKCVPPILCPAHVRIEDKKKPKPCELNDGQSHGLCCETGFNHTAKSANPAKLKNHVSLRSSDIFSEEVIQKLKEMTTHEYRDFPNIQAINRGTADFFHNLLFHSNPAEQGRIRGLSQQAQMEIFASQVYKKDQNIPAEQFQLQEHDGRFEGMFLEHNCNQGKMACLRNNRYRQSQGTCNNLEHPNWGAAGTSMSRLLPPAYVDGIWEPRMQNGHGSSLPNPRQISRQLFNDFHQPHSHLNMMLMQFGQFIAHDVTQTASITDNRGNAISCCTEGDRQPIPHEFKHYACMAIPIPEDDEFYRQFGKGCFNFVRSSLAPNEDCRFNYGQQMNKATHFLDGSMIYGADDHTEHSIREHVGGRLRMWNDYNRELLPVAQPGDKPDECNQSDRPDNACFVSGDSRTNQIISLTAMHIVFAREHNRIARILHELNPLWSDNVLFAETKRIVIALYQIIVFKEWLPLVIGTDTMQRFDLNIHSSGYSSDYDYNMNPSVTNEFTSAAFRYGHSTVDGKFRVHDKTGNLQEIINIPDVMFNPNRLRLHSFYDNMLYTLTGQPMQDVDSSVTHGLSRFLFRGGNPFGSDLVAINIQRGRDHGIRSYNDYLEVSGSPRKKSFHEFGPETGLKLEKVYESVDDIDLWVGGLIEQSQGGALVGPTFADIIADQFTRFRKGDRYFFEHAPHFNPGAFSIDQLNELRKITFSKMICDNGDFINEFAPNAFVQVGVSGNIPVNCNTLIGPDYGHWKEK